MRVISLCAYGGVAFLAGQVFADTGPEVEGIDVAVEADGLDNMGVLSEAEEKAFAASADNHAFQAEVSRMMKMIINSLYKNKEIFLRELISNASDALDKIRFLALSDRSQFDSGDELRVRIRADKERRILHIEDTGIGMTKQELIKNLGTIARSGTSEFLSNMEGGAEAEANNLIGQFGVGFYSSFLVADKVTVTTKSNADDTQWMWTSDAESYTIAADPRPEKMTRGTCISLHLKEEAAFFLQPAELKTLVRKYSEFIDFPIELYEEVEREIEYVYEDDDEEDNADVPDADADNADEDEGVEEEEQEDDDDEDEPKTEMVMEYVQTNTQKPIWTRDPKEVDEEDYKNFYQALTRDHGDPLAKIHFSAEGGEVRFKSLLFVPSASHTRISQATGYGSDLSRNIRLYVNRVFISDEFTDFIPKYLQFIQGIVDSNDLPINVSRENLQADKLLKLIKKKLVRKMIQMLADLASSDPGAYMEVYKAHADNLKMGLIEDGSNRNRLAKLLRFQSSETDGEDGKHTSLEEYVERMREGQSGIYFMAGQSRDECETSPFIEQLVKKGYEVLFMVNPIDEYALQNLPEFAEHKFINAAKETLKFDEETEDNQARNAHFEELSVTYAPTMDYLKTELSDVVDKVVVSTRLEDSPCILVASNYGWTGNMERIMMAQANQGGEMSDHYAKQKKTLEINTRHPLIQKLHAKIHEQEQASMDDGGDDEDASDATDTHDPLADLAKILLDTAMIRSGYTVRDTPAFAERIERMLRLSVGVDPTAAVEVLPVFEANPVIDVDAFEDNEDDVEETHLWDDVDEVDVVEADDEDITTSSHEEL